MNPIIPRDVSHLIRCPCYSKRTGRRCEQYINPTSKACGPHHRFVDVVDVKRQLELEQIRIKKESLKARREEILKLLVDIENQIHEKGI